MALDLVGRRAGRDAAERAPLLYALLAVALVLGALVAAGSVADRSRRVVGGARRGRWPARRWASRPRARCSAACDAGSTSRRPPRFRSTRRAPRSLRPACRSCSRRSPLLVLGALVWLLVGRAPPRRREVRRPAHPPLAAVEGRKKLVLAVIDAMKPAMLERAVASGRAPDARPADGARAPRRRLRRGVPVGDARVLGVDRHRDRARPPPDPVDELVPPRRGALRRVRDELQGVAGVRLQALAHRHDLQHERRAPLARHADGVRVARRRRDSHGRDDLPHVPRPPPARGDERDGADPHRLDGLQAAGPGPAGVLLRRHLRLATHRLPLAARPARRSRPARRLRRRVHGRARPVRLPAALAARQRHALAQARARRHRSRRWSPPTSRSSA